MSVPTLESIHGMIPKSDWETITDNWAERDFAKGAQGGDVYPRIIASRYGAIANLADFVRKSQLANYEAFRAMYEGRNAQLFHPATGVYHVDEQPRPAQLRLADSTTTISSPTPLSSRSRKPPS